MEIHSMIIVVRATFLKSNKTNIIHKFFWVSVCTGAKLLRIWYDEIDGYIKIQDRIRYLMLFDYGGSIKFVIRLNILQAKKVVLQIVR